MSSSSPLDQTFMASTQDENDPLIRNGLDNMRKVCNIVNEELRKNRSIQVHPFDCALEAVFCTMSYDMKKPEETMIAYYEDPRRVHIGFRVPYCSIKDTLDASNFGRNSTNISPLIQDIMQRIYEKIDYGAPTVVIEPEISKNVVDTTPLFYTEWKYHFKYTIITFDNYRTETYAYNSKT